jgi:hypothetical protein
VRVALVVFLAGCGRIGFETSGDGGTASDGRPPCTGVDEDGDTWPDACDNCPSEPNADQRDRGELDAGAVADGVGDACDPRPALTGDYLALFDGFTAPSTTYNFFGVRSYPGNGALRLGTIGDKGQAFFETPATVTRVDLAFDVVDVSATEIQYMGVWSEIAPAETSKIFSQMARDPAAGFTYFNLKEMSPAGDRYSMEVERPDWSLGMRYRTVTNTSLATGGDYTLSVTLGGAAIGQSNLTIGIPHGEQGFLESVEMSAEFTHHAVYAIR